ncbi:hypothetical protein EYF80_029953 [Liparis tanakae]|uniref:Uncharacterized protein n=1 Tax=Liparis tanakae TaxID=230148 RepID=A0A4Z2H1T0_9TELE|nr:hypothetical protein EYF80_029953 [Liparis tanakae]
MLENDLAVTASRAGASKPEGVGAAEWTARLWVSSNGDYVTLSTSVGQDQRDLLEPSKSKDHSIDGAEIPMQSTQTCNQEMFNTEQELDVAMTTLQWYDGFAVFTGFSLTMVPLDCAELLM